MTLHLLVYLNVTEPFWGFCPISNSTYPVNPTCKNISGLHVLLDYPLKGTFSQIIGLCVSAHFTSRSCNHDGKKQRKQQKEFGINKFYKWISDPKVSDCQSQSPDQTLHFVLPPGAVLFSLTYCTFPCAMYRLTSSNFHKLTDHVHTSLHIMFVTARLPLHDEIPSPCTRCTSPTAFLHSFQQLPNIR